ncbi:MAG TPA: WYL domain-containing protein [Steroidobacteraceae bacterium]|nr:WYL domain-containing protein [Steroidobacteraceae bacterium]
MDRLERFYRMHGMLKNRRLVRTREFLEEMEVSRATFKRDLDYMKDRLHAPIVYDRHHEAYRYDESIADRELWQLPGLWFSAEELRALLTMDRLLGDLQPGILSELIGPIRRRLKQLLESGEHSAEDVARRIRILAIGSRKVEPAHFRTISTALLSRRRLRIRHARRQDGEVLEREISPQRLVHYRDNWYLDAWCHKRQALRTFGVDAIESAVVSDKPTRDVPEETLDRHFASGYGIFAGADTQEAVLLFTAERARWVSTEIWHPKQDGKLQLDGSYVLKFPYSQEPELVMDILRYGAGVEVLAPASLRQAVATQLRAAAKRYD